MPSTNKLYSRKSRKNSRKTSGYIAKFLYTFCGIFASFGVVTSLNLLTPASAVGNSSSSNTVSATLPGSVAIRLLNAEGTTEISSLDFNLTPTASGTSATQSMVVDVATSNPTGYKLYMQSDYQDSSSDYTTNLVHTTNGIPDSDISDVIPTSTSASTLYWNYINPLTNAGIEDPSSKVASVIPAHGSPDKLDQYFTTTNSRQTEVSFNVSVDTTIVSGTYENQLLFSAVGNPTTLNYTISFDTDGGTMVGEDITESAAAGTHSITIPNNSDYIPTKSGYSFTHWQIVIPQGSSVTASCNNTNICNPGDNIVIHSGIDSQGDFESTVGLKAIYEASGITSISYMQDMTNEICSNTTLNTEATLTDLGEPGKTYTVAKLADGKCWMTQNYNRSSGNLSSAQYNVPSSGYTVPTSDCSTTSPQWTDNSGNYYCDNPDYEGYYSWAAATAGTNPESGDSSFDICPKGWRLPTQTEFGNLINEYDAASDGSKLTESPINMQYGGGCYTYGCPYFNTTRGIYWSSTTVSNSTQIYRLNFYSSSATNNESDERRLGRPMRCIANDSIHGLTVDPNGGTWEGSAEKRSFTGDSGSTKEISSPTKEDTAYTISYDDNSQGATFTSYPTSTTETFTGWSLNGSGSFENSTYTFGDGSATLTAQYSNNLRSFTLPNIVKPDYTCKWAEGSPSGTQYPGGTFRTISGNTTYYAVCTSANITTISTMQEMTTSVCSNSNTGDGNTLTDIRDNNTYTVRKLADNNCWMTQNLNLQGPITLTPDDSNVSSNWILPTPTENYYQSGDTVTVDANGGSATTLTDKWCNLDTTQQCEDQIVNLYSGNVSYGTYYTWRAAIAGTGDYNTSAGVNATSSICPKGWRLPIGGSSGEFQTLYNYYPSSADMQSSAGPNFVLSGYRSGGNNSGLTTYGTFWSKTAYDNINAYYLLLLSSGVGPAYGLEKYLGFPIRCLAQNPTYTLTVNPNGGTYKGSTDVQSYTGTTGETRTVSNPIGPEAYTISYDDNGQGATYTESPSSATKSFSSWALSGTGSFAGGSYEFGSGNGMLTAQYDTESNMFILPFISKSGYSCQWAEGSPSGTLHTGGSGYTTVSGDTTFYAVCTNNTFNSISNMQEMTPTICVNASTGDAATLTDTRDNKTYTIRKLADGNCWMTQNLNLQGPVTLTSADSDVSSNWILPTPTENGYASGDTVTVDSNGGSANTLTDKWCNLDGGQQCSDQIVNVYSGEPSYGSYYTWRAATAGSGDYNKTSGDASSSVCPKGWRLPTGYDGGEFESLYNKYPSSEALRKANGPAFVMSGNRWGNRSRNQGEQSYYWSSTTHNIYVGRMYTQLSAVYSTGYDYKYNGYGVRCIAKGYDVNVSNSNTTSSTDKLNIPYGGSKTVTVTPNSGYYLSNVNCPSGYTCSGYSTGTSATGTQTVTVTNNNTDGGGTLTFTGGMSMTMQSQAAIDQCKNASTGTTYTLTDTRDNNEYQVRKLADGNCWMVQNLRFSQTGTLSSDTSNVPSGNTFALGSSSTAFGTSCSNTSKWMNAGSTTYGNFYNYYAATAGQGTCSTYSGSVSYDICPRGWKLPTGASGQWQTLYNNYNSSANMRSSTGPALVLAGVRNGSSTNYQGSRGYYWSSTADDSIGYYAYYLYLNTSNVNPALSNYKYFGFSVRCVAK